MARRSVEFVTAQNWERRLAQLEKMTVQEKREFEEKSRVELSVQDIRDQTVGIVYARFGKNEGAFYAVKSRGGATPSTLGKWDRGETYQPRMATIRRTLRACGKDLGIIDL